MKTAIKKFILGTVIPQEYVCIGMEGFLNPLSAFIVDKTGQRILRVTGKHLFLGYKPVVIAIIFNPGEEEYAADDVVVFHLNSNEFTVNTSWKNFNSDKNSIGRLLLKKTGIKVCDRNTIVFYEGSDSWHRLISPIKQKFMSYVEQNKKTPANNINLGNVLYEQVRMAYSIPRIISLVSVFDGKLMNLFPTDLHGPINKNYYTGSLRIGGKACQQVEQNRRIVISEIDASRYKETYALGRRHMQDMVLPSEFSLHNNLSAQFKYPLPAEVGHYKELETVDYFDAGIHRIFNYRVIHEQSVKPINTLAHVHRYYAQWRMDKNLRTSYLFR